MSVFQRNVFQNDAFQVGTVTPPPTGLRRASAQATWIELGLSGFPNAQSIIRVPVGHPGLLLDVDTLEFRDLIHHATIQDAEGFRTLLRIHRNLAGYAGEQRFGHSEFLRLEWPLVNDGAVVGGHAHMHLDSDPGWWILGSCRQNFARRPELSWTRLNVALAAGQTEFDLPEDPIGWGAGTELFIAAMTPPNVTGFADRWERATVQSVSGRHIRLAQPLRWDHLIATHAASGRSFGAEVVKLNERVTMETLQGGAHFYMHTDGVVHYNEGLRMIRCGPVNPNTGLGILARWGGAHPHHATNGDGSQFVRHKIDRARSNGEFFHASHGFEAIDGFALETMVDGNFPTSGPKMWDPDTGGGFTNASHRVKWIRCGAAVVYRPENAASHIQRQGGFVMSKGFDCILEDCFATSCAQQSQAAGLHYPEGSFGVWRIQKGADRGAVRGYGFVAHNNRRGRSDWWNETAETGDRGPHRASDEVYFWNERGHFHGAYGNSAQIRNQLVFGNSISGFEQHCQGAATIWPSSNHFDGIIDSAPFGGPAWVAATHASAQSWVTYVRYQFRGPVIVRKRFGFSEIDGDLSASAMGAPERLRFLDCTWQQVISYPDAHVNTNGSLSRRVHDDSQIHLQPDPRSGQGAVLLRPAHVDPRNNQPTVPAPAGGQFVRAWGAFAVLVATLPIPVPVP